MVICLRTCKQTTDGFIGPRTTATGRKDANKDFLFVSPRAKERGKTKNHDFLQIKYPRPDRGPLRNLIQRRRLLELLFVRSFVWRRVGGIIVDFLYRKQQPARAILFSFYAQNNGKCKARKRTKPRTKQNHIAISVDAYNDNNDLNCRFSEFFSSDLCHRDSDKTSSKKEVWSLYVCRTLGRR